MRKKIKKTPPFSTNFGMKSIIFWISLLMKDGGGGEFRKVKEYIDENKMAGWQVIGVEIENNQMRLICKESKSVDEYA